MDTQARIQDFIAGEHFAVAGASRHPHKYGNKVVRCLAQNHRKVSPINPHAGQIEGVPAFPTLAAIPELPDGLCVITPPEVTRSILRDAADLGLRRIWLQPGAEDPAVLELADHLGLSLISGGPCLLVVMGYHET